MTDKKKMWNGGKTNITTKYANIFRQMEDGYDLDDSEIEFRKELVERERLMREEAKNQKIQSKYSLSKKPMHELYTTNPILSHLEPTSGKALYNIWKSIT